MRVMILLACFTAFLPVGSAFGETRLLEEFYAAAADSELAEAHEDRMRIVAADGSVLERGHHGMALMLLAKFSSNPISKLTHFNEGRELIDEAISDAPNEIELRFLRYSVQIGAPSFLGYRGNLAEDRRILDTFLTGTNVSDPYLRSKINELRKLDPDRGGATHE